MKISPPSMAPAVTRSPKWAEWANLLTAIFVFVLFPVAAHAGGLAIAPLAAILGGMGLLTYLFSRGLRRPPIWVAALLVLFLWAYISTFWSAYEDSQALINPVKLALGTVLFLGSFLAFSQISAAHWVLLEKLFIGVMWAALALLMIDLITTFALTNFVDPLQEGERLREKNVYNMMNVGHSVTAMVVALPLTLLLMIRHFRQWRIPAFSYVILLFGFSIYGGLAIGVLVPPIALLAMLIGFKARGAAVRAATFLAMASLLLAPLWGWVMTLIPDGMRAAVPFSWDHRIEMWRYSVEKIVEAPVFGHGFDAVRVFDGTFDSRGWTDLNIISLHPHNFGLHIWSELGLVGVLIASAVIFLAGRAIWRLPLRRKQSAAACGLIVSMSVIGLVSYGVWQDWLWALLIFCAAFTHSTFFTSNT